MGEICVIGLGSTDITSLNQNTITRIKSGERIFSRTSRHEAIKSLNSELKIEFFDSYYENLEDITKVEEEIANRLILEAEDSEIIYLVPGSPFILEKSVELLIGKTNNISFINNESANDLVFSCVKYVTDGYIVVCAKDFNRFSIDYSKDLLILEIDNQYILDEIILLLKELFPEDTRFSIIKDGGLKSEEIYTSNLEKYERRISPNHQTSLLLYKIRENTYGFSKLLEITDTLRGPEGCPWDIDQTHESMRQNLLEESYEAVEAVNKKDYENLCEELGDVLFQVVINSQIAYENGDFSIHDVIKNLNNKLILRHPHVFGDLHLDKSLKVLQNWDSIKYSKRDINTFWEKLNSTKGMPSTIRAYDIIDKVTRIGFDWTNKNEILEKVKEEYLEVIDALDDPIHLEEELGDLLFTVSNLSHYLGYEPELLLTKACDKFVGRFKQMEEIVSKEKKKIENLDKSELENLWQLSKLS